jgi:D-arabinose 1-dehydrogenase-like Zn-dependent alcohol dehydrogenase
MAPTVTKFRGSPSGKIIETTAPWPTLKGTDVLVEVQHAGFCGTDLHYLQGDLVVGHEGAGVIKEIGPGVRHLKV